MRGPPAPDRFETVAYVYSPSDLALLLSLFGHADIHVLAIGRGHASVDLGLTTALGGVALRVHEEDLDAARAMLAALDPVPHRAPLLTGIFPFDLFFFLVVAIFGMAPPPRQIPTYVLGESVRREA
jgi:hypothetical protein